MSNPKQLPASVTEADVKLKLTKSELKEIENAKGSDAPFFENEEKEEVEVVK